MAKTFSNREKEIIRKALIEKGKEFFSTWGLKKTSIEDLTQAVGIAKGSFYAFFNSKEELYLEIHEVEEEVIRGDFMEKTFGSGEMTKNSFKAFVINALKIMTTNPLIKQIYEKGYYENLLRKIPQDKLERHFKRDTEWLLSIIKKGQAEGIIIDKNPNIIVSLLRSLFAIPLHKELIDEEYYHETIELIAEFISNGLVKGGEKDD